MYNRRRNFAALPYSGRGASTTDVFTGWTAIGFVCGRRLPKVPLADAQSARQLVGGQRLATIFDCGLNF